MQLKEHWPQSSEKTQRRESSGLQDGWKTLVLLGKEICHRGQSWDYNCMFLVKVPKKPLNLPCQFCCLNRDKPDLKRSRSERAAVIY